MKYITILRGINVGGHRKILMSDLKSLFNDIGLKEVTSYIQSGNLLFYSQESKDHLEVLISEAIEANYGFSVPVIVISVKAFIQLSQINPYKETASLEKMHVTFLKQLPAKENIEHILSYNFEYDKFIIIEQFAFLMIEGKYHKSKLSNNFFEKQLKVQATTRNWKTVLKLIELSAASTK